MKIKTTTDKKMSKPRAGLECPDRSAESGKGCLPSKDLMTFCEKLSMILIRSYSAETDVAELRAKVCARLVATLKCTAPQARCLVDLSLELIHLRIHGRYRRSKVELSYLIAVATGAVGNVGEN